MTRVLILGAGAAPANGYTRALRLSDAVYYLIGANTNEDDLLLAETDETHHLEPGSQQALWDLVQRTKPDFIHPQPEPEILRLSSCRHMFRKDTVYLPYHQTILACQDKWQTHELWRDKHIPQPTTVKPDSPGHLLRLFREADGADLWLRLTHGGGGKGSLRTADFGLAEKWISRHHGWDGRFTVASVLPGRSVTWMSVWYRGRLLACQQRLRLGWANAQNSPTGVSGSTAVGETCSDPRVDEIAPAAVLAVDERAHGLFGVDMTYDEHGVPNPTEINCGRFFTTASEFFARAGFNMAHIYTQTGSGYRTLKKPGDNWRNPLPDGYRWVRAMDKLPTLVRPDGSIDRGYDEMSQADRAVWSEWYDRSRRGVVTAGT